MTGFATARGDHGPLGWAWDLRSVNGKGLDIRLRVPDWIEGLEPATRSRLSAALGRGSVTAGLRVSRAEAEEGGVRLAEAQVGPMLDALARIEAEAMDRGLTLGPSTAAQVLNLRGMIEQSGAEEVEPAAILPAILADLDTAIAGLIEMRAAEGRALVATISDQLDQVEGLVEDARAAVADRADETAANLRAALARVMENTEGADETRVAQELALIAVKSDVTEEIDRLTAHIAAARDLLAQEGPVGRKLDFLMQEFNREANTLCSKAGSRELTAVGLDLKAVIDQMREQVQNVE